MHKNIVKLFVNLSFLKGLVASAIIISIILISSCTKRECRESISIPVLKIRLKKQFTTTDGIPIFIKDTFLRITKIIGVGRSPKDSSLYTSLGLDSLNVLNLSLSPKHDTTSFIITWKSKDTVNKVTRQDRIKFKYVPYQVQTSELCGFQFYFKNLEIDTAGVKNQWFKRIYIIKPTVNLVNDTIHAYLYLN